MTAYAELLLEAEPQVLENREQYDVILARVDTLIRRGRSRTPDETKLMRLLSLLIQDYDQRHALAPDDSTPAERLQHLLEISGKKPADLLPVFGQRSHVNEALTGKRQISGAQARKLAEIFHLKAGYFL
jgi:antitoxin component HigA of HigAB toxin-antitoxin module